MYKQIGGNIINNNKAILTIKIIKFQPSPIPIILNQLLWLSIGISFLMMRLLIILVVLVTINHRMHVVISGIVSAIVLWVYLVVRVHCVLFLGGVIWGVVLWTRRGVLRAYGRLFYILGRRLAFMDRALSDWDIDSAF